MTMPPDDRGEQTEAPWPRPSRHRRPSAPAGTPVTSGRPESRRPGAAPPLDAGRSRHHADGLPDDAPAQESPYFPNGYQPAQDPDRSRWQGGPPETPQAPDDYWLAGDPGDGGPPSGSFRSAVPGHGYTTSDFPQFPPDRGGYWPDGDLDRSGSAGTAGPETGHAPETSPGANGYWSGGIPRSAPAATAPPDAGYAPGASPDLDSYWLSDAPPATGERTGTPLNPGDYWISDAPPVPGQPAAGDYWLDGDPDSSHARDRAASAGTGYPPGDSAPAAPGPDAYWLDEPPGSGTPQAGDQPASPYPAGYDGPALEPDDYWLNEPEAAGASPDEPPASPYPDYLPEEYPEAGYLGDSYPSAGYPGGAPPVPDLDPDDYPGPGAERTATGYPGYPAGRDLPGPRRAAATGASRTASTNRAASTSTGRAGGASRATRAESPADPADQTARTALILGILGPLGSVLNGVLAAVFGVRVLRGTPRAGARQRRTALIATVLGAVWVALAVVAAVLLLGRDGTSSVPSLAAGTCFDDTAPHQATVQVKTLPSCVLPHNGEVVGGFAIPGTAWPGQAAISRAAADGCAALVDGVLGQNALPAGVRGMNYTPSEQSWSGGTRAVSCVLVDPDKTHTGSLLSGSVAPQG